MVSAMYGQDPVKSKKKDIKNDTISIDTLTLPSQAQRQLSKMDSLIMQKRAKLAVDTIK